MDTSRAGEGRGGAWRGRTRPVPGSGGCRSVRGRAEPGEGRTALLVGRWADTGGRGPDAGGRSWTLQAARGRPLPGSGGCRGATGVPRPGDGRTAPVAGGPGHEAARAARRAARASAADLDGSVAGGAAGAVMQATQTVRPWTRERREPHWEHGGRGAGVRGAPGARRDRIRVVSTAAWARMPSGWAVRWRRRRPSRRRPVRSQCSSSSGARRCACTGPRPTGRGAAGESRRRPGGGARRHGWVWGRGRAYWASVDERRPGPQPAADVVVAPA